MLRQSLCRRLHLFRRVMVHKHGGPEQLMLEDFTAKDLTVGEHDVLVRNSFAGVNFIDTYYRTGLYKKPTMPFVCGEEGSGAIVKVGSKVSTKRLGERVAYFSGSSGAYSSFATVAAQDAFPIPDGVRDDIAAAAMLQGCTAHYLCESIFPVKRGDVVLIHAVAGGTGLLLSQMCKEKGATVIGTCSGGAKMEIAAGHGRADYVIDYRADGGDWVPKVRAICSKGVSCVFDGVGQATFHGSLKALRRRGTMVSFGNASGAVEPVSPLLLTQHGSVALHRPTLRDYSSHEGNEAAWRVGDVLKSINDGKLLVHIGKTFALQHAREAHEYLEARHSLGKILVNCQE